MRCCTNAIPAQGSLCLLCCGKQARAPLLHAVGRTQPCCSGFLPAGVGEQTLVFEVWDAAARGGRGASLGCGRLAVPVRSLQHREEHAAELSWEAPAAATPAGGSRGSIQAKAEQPGDQDAEQQRERQQAQQEGQQQPQQQGSVRLQLSYMLQKQWSFAKSGAGPAVPDSWGADASTAGASGARQTLRCWGLVAGQARLQRVATACGSCITSRCCTLGPSSCRTHPALFLLVCRPAGPVAGLPPRQLGGGARIWPAEGRQRRRGGWGVIRRRRCGAVRCCASHRLQAECAELLLSAGLVCHLHQRSPELLIDLACVTPSPNQLLPLCRRLHSLPHPPQDWRRGPGGRRQRGTRELLLALVVGC